MQANGLTVKKLIEIRGDVLRFDDPPINMKPGHLRKMQRGLYNVARVMDFNFKFVERRADLEKEAKLEKEREALRTKRDERDEDENHMLLNSTAESQVAVVENEYWDNQEDYRGVGGSDASEGYYDEQGEWVENDHYVQNQYYGEEGERNGVGKGEEPEQEERGADVEQELKERVTKSGKETPNDRVPETTTDNALKSDITTSACAGVDAADVVPSETSKGTTNGTSTKQQLLLVSTTEVASNNTTVPDTTHVQCVPSAQVDENEQVEIEGIEEIEEKKETRTKAEKEKEIVSKTSTRTNNNNNQEEEREEKQEKQEKEEKEDDEEEEEEEDDSDDDAPLPNEI